MSKYIVIERPNGMATMVRSIIETASEDPLTDEEIINELCSKVKNLNIPAVVWQSEQLCPICKSDDLLDIDDHYTRCQKCGFQFVGA